MNSLRRDASGTNGGSVNTESRDCESAVKRKNKIKSLEAARVANIPKSALELEEEAEREHKREMLRTRNANAMEEAKHMANMVEFARVVRARDVQLTEKATAQALDKLREASADADMERVRLQYLAAAAARVEEKRIETKRVAVSIRAQVAERAAARQDATTVLRAEGKAAAEEMQAALERVTETRAAARRAQAEELAVVLAANEASIAARAQMREAEAAENARLARVQAEMAAKKAAEDDERTAVARARDAAAFKVRGQVQKLQDNRGELDELRANRAFEDGQRAERLRIAQRHEREVAMRADLRASRTELLALKQARMASEIESEKAEFERALAVQAAWLAVERSASEAKRGAEHRHVLELADMMRVKEKSKQLDAAALRAEGEEHKHAAAARADILVGIRASLVSELRSEGLRVSPQLTSYAPDALVKADYKLGKAALKARGENSKAGTAAAAATAATAKQSAVKGAAK